MADRIAAHVAYLGRLMHRHKRYYRHNRSWVRRLNLLLNEFEYHLASPRVFSMPYSIFLDPVNMCPLQCPLCGTGLRQEARKRHILSFAEFTSFVKQLVPFLYEIKFYNYGEPFLNPDIPAMIRHMAQKRILTQVNTNCMVLNEDYAREVIGAGLCRMVVSFDGMTQETYGKYRRKGDLATVKANIAMVNRIKGECASVTPELVLQYLVNRYNEHEVAAARDYAATVGATLFLTPLMIDITSREQREEWLPTRPEFQLYNLQTLSKIKEEPEKRCGFLWNDCVINVDGGVSPCCHLFFGTTDFGNLHTTSFRKIWNNRAFRTSRRIFRDRRIGSCTTACARCVNPAAFSDPAIDLVNENRTNNLR